MRDDLRQAKAAVARLTEKGEKEYYIDRCDLTAAQAEILRRRYTHRQTITQISMEMHLSRECVEKQFRAAVLILYDIISRCRR
jgi:hypothetical protein